MFGLCVTSEFTSSTWSTSSTSHRRIPCLSLSLLPAPFFFSTVWASSIFSRHWKPIFWASFLFSPNRKHLILRKLRTFCFPYAFMSLNPHPTKKRLSALNLSSYYTSTFHLGPIPGIQSCTCPYTQMIRSIGRMMVGSVHICYLS